MSKKILLLTSVIFLSSCATTNISELGDKFLDLINPSDQPEESIDLSQDELIMTSDDGNFTISELEALSNDELIAIAKEKGLEDLLLLDEDGNLLNRDQIINAILESGALLQSRSDELNSMSDAELMEVAKAKGLGDLIVLDADGNLANREELIEALLENDAATRAAISEFCNQAECTLYFAYDDSEIDELATRIIIEHANFMQENPSVNVRLEGHADERGTREYNLALGENRALSVKEVLGLYNLDDRIIVVSYGEEDPVLTESNEAAWEKNRRVEIVYY
jgi:peptidoglycan-associated lipoprotein